MRAKKEIQAEFYEAYSDGREKILSVKFFQEQPNTFALVTFYPGQGVNETEEFGFAKCSGVTKHHGPDVWNPQYGKNLAVQKAIAKHAKRLVNGNN